MKRIKERIAYAFRFSIFDIVISGILIALFVVSNQFIKLDFGVMKMGIYYAWLILMGLILKPVLAVITALLADILYTAIFLGFGFWMYEYALAYPLIALVSALLKQAFNIKNQKLWWTMVCSINGLTILIAIFFAIFYNDRSFGKNPNVDSTLHFDNVAVKALIWACIGIMIITFGTLLIICFKKPNCKMYLSIYSLVTIVIIIFIWIWGPIAQIRFLVRIVGKDSDALWKTYDIFFIPRILKTPVSMLVYTTIVTAVYKAYLIVNQKNQLHAKW